MTKTMYRVNVEVPGHEERIKSSPIALSQVADLYLKACHLMIEKGWVSDLGDRDAPAWHFVPEEGGVERDATEAEISAVTAQFEQLFGGQKVSLTKVSEEDSADGNNQ